MSPIHPGSVRFLIFIFGGWLTMARTLGMLVLLAVVLQGEPAGAGCDSQQASRLQVQDESKGPKCGATPCGKHPKKMCGGTRCCEGDQCLDGVCISVP
jgi:hypothetical protein